MTNREAIWDEAEELSCSLRELTDAELVECRDALLDRAKRIMSMSEVCDETE